MDKAVNSALHLDFLLGLIKPVGESGKYAMHHLQVWRPGQESGLRKEYQRLQAVMDVLCHNKKSIEQFRSALVDIPRLPQTLKALQERPLLLHECFELKKLLYYAVKLQKLCINHSLDKYYPFPELHKPYSLLDPEHIESPTFALSAAFDTGFARYLSRLQELQLARRQAEHKLLQSAKQSLQLNQATDTIVVSRSQNTLINQLEKSHYYQLTDENFVNLTYKLKATPHLVTLKKQISVLTIKLTHAEEKVLHRLSNKLKPYSKILLQTADLIVMLDWDYAKAIFAAQYNCSIPILSKKLQINITEAANLPVKENLSQDQYQPVNLQFDTRINVLTGPNMGGKTTALKTLGQICLLTQFAIPVPAKSAGLCLFDNIWFNHDNTNAENLSSFGREIVSLANILKKKGRNLLLMDELAKGTNPAEGEVILIAVLEYLKKLPCLTLAATHFDKPALLKSVAHYAIKGIDINALTGLIKSNDHTLKEQLNLLNSLMDYSLVKLSKQQKPPQNAIPIARALGLPEEIINRAVELI